MVEVRDSDSNLVGTLSRTTNVGGPFTSGLVVLPAVIISLRVMQLIHVRKPPAMLARIH